MSYTADYLIFRRKEKWKQHHDIQQDKIFCEAVANELVTDPALLAEVICNPEKLIELVFVVVDKDQNTLPFFLNEVQQEFIATLNQAIEDFQNGLISEIALFWKIDSLLSLVSASVNPWKLRLRMLHDNW